MRSPRASERRSERHARALGSLAGTRLAYSAGMDQAINEAGAQDNEAPTSIFLVSLHIIEWTVLVCGFVMMMVVFMLNW